MVAQTLQAPNYILAARLTPDREIARAPSPSPQGRKGYTDPSPSFNALHGQMLREPSPSRRARCPSPTFQMLQQDMNAMDLGRSRSPSGRVRAPPQRSQSPIITITNHGSGGAPPWAFAPTPHYEPAPPAPAAGLSAPDPRFQRAQSPSFNELERQMAERAPQVRQVRPPSPRQARPLSPRLLTHDMQRKLAASPTIVYRSTSPMRITLSPVRMNGTTEQTVARHTPSPTPRSRQPDRRAAQLSSPVPFKRATSPYRHVSAPAATGPQPPWVQAPKQRVQSPSLRVQSPSLRNSNQRAPSPSRAKYPDFRTPSPSFRPQSPRQLYPEQITSGQRALSSVLRNSIQRAPSPGLRNSNQRAPSPRAKYPDLRTPSPSFRSQSPRQRIYPEQMNSSYRVCLSETNFPG